MAAKRLTRKEILKDDPFRDALQDTFDAIIANKNAILIGLITVVAVIAVGVLWQNTAAKAEAESQYSLSRGLEAFHATARNPNEPPPNSQQQAQTPPPEFKSDAEKYTEALKRFQDTAAKYPSRRAGLMAQYYIALCQQRLSNPDEAAKTLENIRNRFKESTFDGVVKRTLAELYESKSKYDEAAKLCQELVEDRSTTLPKDPILLMLGRCYEGLNKKDEAIKTYTRLAQEYPNSVYVGDANRAITKLGGKPVPPPLPAPGASAPGLGGMPFSIE